jgi:hypothetical protein
MKKILLITIFFCWTGAAHAQSAETLTGTWLLKWNETKNKMSSAELDRFNGMPAEVKTRIQNSFSDRQYTFNSNGTLSVSWQSAQGAKTETGSWSIDDNMLVLEVNQDERRYSMTMEGEYLILSINNPMAGATFSKLALKKN